MPKAIRLYVKYVDEFNRRLGRATMYLVFVMMAVLLLSSASKIANIPLLWVVEMAQFVMTAYYIVGGPYTLQDDSHVRMDLIYGRFSERGKAIVDTLTIAFLIFYLVFLFYGGVSSTLYALEYGQKNYSAWAPPLAPIKIIMCIGIGLMVLQAVSIFFKDLARAMGRKIA